LPRAQSAQTTQGLDSSASEDLEMTSSMFRNQKAFQSEYMTTVPAIFTISALLKKDQDINSNKNIPFYEIGSITKTFCELFTG